jgi:hypothetical protein
VRFCRQRGRLRIEAGARVFDAARQRAGIGRKIELGEALRGCVRERMQLVGLRPVATRHVVDRGHTRFDACVLGGIDIGAPQVVAKRARCLVYLDRSRLEQRDDVVQRSVVRTRLPQALHELSKPSRKRIVAFAQSTFRPGGRLDQAGRVGEPALRRSEFGPFGGAN